MVIASPGPWSHGSAARTPPRRRSVPSEADACALRCALATATDRELELLQLIRWDHVRDRLQRLVGASGQGLVGVIAALTAPHSDLRGVLRSSRDRRVRALLRLDSPLLLGAELGIECRLPPALQRAGFAVESHHGQ